MFDKKFLLKLLIIQLVLIVSMLLINFSVAWFKNYQSPYAQHLKIAFDHGQLIQKAHAGFDSIRGDWQYEDCQILQQGMNLSDVFLQNVFNAPKFGDATKCGSLYTVLSNLDKANEKGWTYYQLIDHISKTHIKTYGYPEPYVQYLHGGKALAVLLVSVMHLSTVRFLYQKINYFLIFLVSLIVALSGRLSFNRRIAFSIVFFVIFSFFHGIDYFGMGLAIGPAEMLGSITFIFLMKYLYRDNLEGFLITLLVSGALTAYLEKLLGILPAIAALLSIALLLIYAADENANEKKTVKLLLSGLIIYTLGFLITYFTFMILKMTITGAHLSPGFGRHGGANTWSYWLSAFSLRVGSTVNSVPVTYAQEISLLWSRMVWLSSSTFVAHFVLIYSVIGMFAVGLVNLVFPKLIPTNNNYTKIIGFALIPILIVIAWYLIFKNHTTIHVWFMERLLSYIMFAGWFVTASYFIDLLSYNNKKIVWISTLIILFLITCVYYYHQYKQTGFY